jgi:hypothetical protein
VPCRARWPAPKPGPRSSPTAKPNGSSTPTHCTTAPPQTRRWPAYAGANHEPTTLTYQSIYHWRSALDRLLAAAERDDPALWAQARTPGTWLDALLRLRVVLTHVTSKAYWSGHTTITYGDVEIERYLWGAR